MIMLVFCFLAWRMLFFSFSFRVLCLSFFLFKKNYLMSRIHAKMAIITRTVTFSLPKSFISRRFLLKIILTNISVFFSATFESFIILFALVSNWNFKEPFHWLYLVKLMPGVLCWSYWEFWRCRRLEGHRSIFLCAATWKWRNLRQPGVIVTYHQKH